VAVLVRTRRHRDVPVSDPAPDRADAPATLVVDFPRTIRRLRTSLTVIGSLVLIAWLVVGAVGDGWSLRSLAELFGMGLFLAFAAEVLVVGGSAVRGLLNAGERGDRLASADVSLLPPQLRRRR
jgi:hypothetical protein